MLNIDFPYFIYSLIINFDMNYINRISSKFDIMAAKGSI